MLRVLAEELLVIDAAAAMWQVARPLLDAARHVEQNNTSYSWYGWNKTQIDAFLKNLPTHCTLVVCVWENAADAGVDAVSEHEALTLGLVCEVVDGNVTTVRTLESFKSADFPLLNQLEPGFEHALEIMRVVRIQVAPVAWSLFTDETTWYEWLFTCKSGELTDKGELLAEFAQQGRCVLIGSQTWKL